jgi:hypothetical protein
MLTVRKFVSTIISLLDEFLRSITLASLHRRLRFVLPSLFGYQVVAHRAAHGIGGKNVGVDIRMYISTEKIL